MVFSKKLCQNRGVIRRVNSSDTGAARCPGRPAVEHASRKGFLSGGRATPTKAVMQKGLAHLRDESSLFTIPHQNGKVVLHM